MKTNDTETAIDPLTREVFIPKRTNQIFATRENQIKYNNLKAAKERKAKARSRKILDNNRKVLQNILGSNQEEKKSLDYLKGAGLNFRFCTQTIRTEEGNLICIDDYAYILIDTNTFKIIKLNF